MLGLTNFAEPSWWSMIYHPISWWPIAKSNFHHNVLSLHTSRFIFLFFCSQLFCVWIMFYCYFIKPSLYYSGSFSCGRNTIRWCWWPNKINSMCGYDVTWQPYLQNIWLLMVAKAHKEQLWSIMLIASLYKLDKIATKRTCMHIYYKKRSET